MIILIFVAVVVANFRIYSAEVWNGQTSNPTYTSGDINLYDEQCLRMSGITSEELIKLMTVRTEKCMDPFELDERALCYLFCVRRNKGLFDDQQNPNHQAYIDLYYYLNENKIHQLLDECVKKVDSDPLGGRRKCWRSFAINRCFEAGIGAYPPGTHHVVIASSIPSDLQAKCMEISGVSPEELCHAVTDRCEDHFVNNSTLQCYHTCILENLGFANGEIINVELVGQFFWYIEPHIRDDAIKRCLNFVESQKFIRPCEYGYEFHRCFKRLIGEYPIH